MDAQPFFAPAQEEAARDEPGEQALRLGVDLRDGALPAHLVSPLSGLCRVCLIVRLLTRV